VAVIPDTKLEPNERLVVNLMNAVNASGIVRDGFVNIQDDDDLPIIEINDATVDEATPDVTLTVTLSHLSATPIDVTWNTVDNTATAPGGDYNTQSGTVTIPANTLSQSFTLTGVINDDPMLEPTESFFVQLATVPTLNAAIGRELAVVSITDNDVLPAVSIDDVQLREGDAGGKIMTFTITLSAPAQGIVSVKYVTADAGCAPDNVAETTDEDYLPASGTARFDPGETTDIITVIILGDTDVESYEQFEVTLFDPTVNAMILPEDGSTSDGVGVGTILDDDIQMTLTASPNPQYTFLTVDLTATLGTGIDSLSGCDPAVEAGLVGPTGMVSFYDGVTHLGDAPIIAGVATLAGESFPTPGIHNLTAEYPGDANWSPATAATELEMLLLGDLNKDLVVNLADLVILANAIAGNLNPGDAPWTAPADAADLNQDTFVNVGDLVILANYVAGNIGSLPQP
jgi:hypothetical protein